METNLKKIRIKYKKLFSGKKLGQTVHNPTQSWFWIVVSATSVALLLCCVGVYEFLFEQNIQNPVAENTNISPTAFTKIHIEEIATRYREQTERFVELRSLVPTIPDTGVMQAEPIVESQTETLLVSSEESMEVVPEGETESETGEVPVVTN
jgi:hypothetical protein